MKKLLLLSACAVALSACDTLYPPTPHPDYAIRVQPTDHGGVATAQPCASWETQNANPYDNQPAPQFGCSTQQALAAEIERPDDLLEGRQLGPARGVTTVGAIRRYDNNQTRGLITTGSEVNSLAVTTAAASASSLTGDVTGGAGASSGSSSSTTSASVP